MTRTRVNLNVLKKKNRHCKVKNTYMKHYYTVRKKLLLIKIFHDQCVKLKKSKRSLYCSYFWLCFSGFGGSTVPQLARLIPGRRIFRFLWVSERGEYFVFGLLATGQSTLDRELTIPDQAYRPGESFDLFCFALEPSDSKSPAPCQNQTSKGVEEGIALYDLQNLVFRLVVLLESSIVNCAGL